MMKTRMILRYLAFGAIAFLGGAASNMFSEPAVIHAAAKERELAPKVEAKLINAGEVNVSRLNVMDSKGKVRVTIRTVDDHPFVGLYDRNGDCRLMLGVEENGSPAFSLLDKGKIPRVFVSAQQGTGPTVQLLSKNGEVQTASLTTIDEKLGDFSSLFLRLGSNGKAVAGMSASDLIGGDLGVFDTKGKPVWIVKRSR